MVFWGPFTHAAGEWRGGGEHGPVVHACVFRDHSSLTSAVLGISPNQLTTFKESFETIYGNTFELKCKNKDL
jgi:hypothetical protein